MKRSQWKTLWMLLASLPLLASGCPVKNIEVPLIARANVSFPINTTTGSYADAAVVDVTSAILDAIRNAELDPDRVLAIELESVTFLLTDVNTQTNTIVSGVLRVGPTNLNQSAQASRLAAISGVDLQAVEGSNQTPALDSMGVSYLNTTFSNALGLGNFLGGGGSAVFKAFVDGNVTPAAANPSFQLSAAMKITVIVLDEVCLPEL